MRKGRTVNPLTEEALYEYAVKLLGQQMRTVAQLKRLLHRRTEPGEAGQSALESVLVRLRERRYLDDTGFAQDYAKLRQENASFGRRRVQQDLIRKGVHADVISTTLDAAYENVDEEALARRHLERKRVRRPETDRESARVMRMLIRAGFSSATVFRVLRQWKLPDEALEALHAEEEDDTAEES